MPLPPVHAQPSFFETTVVEIPGKKKTRYTHQSYEEQRGKQFGTLEMLRDAATERLLDDGWVPGVHGGLVSPEFIRQTPWGTVQGDIVLPRDPEKEGEQ